MKKSIKKMTLTGYKVEYVDLREPKPRSTHTDTIVYDADGITAAEVLGICLSDRIKDRYAGGGYHVLSITKLQRISAEVDLLEVYAKASIMQGV